MSDDKKVREKYVQLQLIHQKIQELQQSMQALEQQLAENDYVVASLLEFKGVKSGKEILFPVASGVFARAKLVDSSKVLVNVGAGAMVEKSIDEAGELVASQGGEIRSLLGQFTAQVDSLMHKSEDIQKELQNV